MSDDKQYNLQDLYGAESPLQKYRRLTVGQGTSVPRWLIQELVLFLLPFLPGVLGYGLRRLIYPNIFKGFDRSATVGHQVMLRCPSQIRLSSGVIVDDYAQLIATTREDLGIEVGANSFIRSFAMLNAGPPEGYIKIGERSSVGQSSILYGTGGLSIGNDVMIAGQCFLVASSHRTDDPQLPMSQQGITAKGITIEDNVWLGAGVKVLDGVTLGKGTIVGANAVVTKSYPAGSKLAGVPAKPIVS